MCNKRMRALLPMPIPMPMPMLMLMLLLMLMRQCSVQRQQQQQQQFLIYKIEAAVKAAPAIFGRYLETLWRQLLAAADAFRAEHWVQPRR